MDFQSGSELLALCRAEHCRISGAMARREETEVGTDAVSAAEQMAHVIEVMRSSAAEPLEAPRRSNGGLIGGEAAKFREAARRGGPDLLGPCLSRATAYALAVSETNASMGLIVAAPTAGAAGVLPGALLACQETFGLSDEALSDGLKNAAAVGLLLMQEASVSGAEAGCQAEVGAAAAMAASALTEMLGGTPEQCLQAASMALAGLLGLVCDPVGGLVECPCQTRNAVGVSAAFSCAQMALAGITFPIPFDEMAGAMRRVGRALPASLRETALGGCAATETGCKICR